MTADEVYSLMKYIVNKNQQGVLVSSEFNRVINAAQIQYVAYLLGNFQTYTPGRPVAKVELGQNSVVRQRLAPVIYGYNLNISPYGHAPYPADYLQTDSMWSIYGQSIYNPLNKKIRFVQQHQLDSYYNSVIDQIQSNPIYLLDRDNFQFYPTNTYEARLHYVQDPPKIIWAFVLDGNNRQVYDPTNSVDPVFDNLAMMEIISRALFMVGINLQSSAVIQYANEKIKSGE